MPGARPPSGPGVVTTPMQPQQQAEADGGVMVARGWRRLTTMSSEAWGTPTQAEARAHLDWPSTAAALLALWRQE